MESLMGDPDLEKHRDEILRMAQRHGAQRVRIFGSAARGESGEDSDVDLLVALDEGRSLLDLIALKQEIEDLLQRSVDVVTDRALSPYIRDRVLAEAIPL
jgi:predicted nucleotidyltransferase